MLGRALADAIHEVLKLQVHGVDLRRALRRGRPGRLHSGPYRRAELVYAVDNADLQVREPRAQMLWALRCLREHCLD